MCAVKGMRARSSSFRSLSLSLSLSLSNQHGAAKAKAEDGETNRYGGRYTSSIETKKVAYRHKYQKEEAGKNETTDSKKYHPHEHEHEHERTRQVITKKRVTLFMYLQKIYLEVDVDL
jgi:hypothetical protein